MRVVTIILQIAILIVSFLEMLEGHFEMAMLGLIMVELLYLEVKIEDGRTINMYMNADEIDKFIEKLKKTMDRKDK